VDDEVLKVMEKKAIECSECLKSLTGDVQQRQKEELEFLQKSKQKGHDLRVKGAQWNKGSLAGSEDPASYLGTLVLRVRTYVFAVRAFNECIYQL
jgi:hypothetical protein